MRKVDSQNKVQYKSNMVSKATKPSPKKSEKDNVSKIQGGSKKFSQTDKSRGVVTTSLSIANSSINKSRKSG
jgi:hypothetical protein